MANTEKKGVIYYLEQILNAVYKMSGQTPPAEDDAEDDGDN